MLVGVDGSSDVLSASGTNAGSNLAAISATVDDHFFEHRRVSAWLDAQHPPPINIARTDAQMENLSLHDAGPPGGPPVPQLPPQMFTTAAQLLDLTDKKLMVSLRDGKKLIGVLRSWDQFGNLVLQETVERVFVKNLYADIERGLFLVRGENVLLLGEIDLDKDDYIPDSFQQADAKTVFELKKQEEKERKANDKSRQKKLAEFGFEGEHSGEVIF